MALASELPVYSQSVWANRCLKPVKISCSEAVGGEVGFVSKACIHFETRRAGKLVSS